MKLYPILVLLTLYSCQSSENPADEETIEVVIDSLNAELQMAAQEGVVIPIEKEDPIPVPDYDTIQWTDLAIFAPTIKIDMRYATTNNFVEEQMYACGRCFLRPEVAAAIVEAHEQLQQQGLGLKMYDCFRPRPIQWKLWNKTPDPRYVSDPRKGSMHNRGAAVDLTIVDENGEELDMGTDFDFFGRRAYQTYIDLPEEILNNRKLLRETLATVGFRHIRTEWWHYAFTKKRYALSDMLWTCEEDWAME